MALVTAVRNGDIFQVRKLLESASKANTNCKNKKAMYEAIQENNNDIIKLLLEYGSFVDDYLISYIFYEAEDCEFAKECLVQIFKNGEVGELIYEMLDALVSSTYVGASAVEILKLLLDHGLPVDEFIWENTPLQLALIHGKIEFVELLLERGADVNKKTPDGMSCFNYADDPAMLKLLLKKGARVNDRDDSGRTALYGTSFEVLPLLLRLGADINVQDNDGLTPFTFEPYLDKEEIFVKHLAQLKFENQFISAENLKHLDERQDLRKLFEECLGELQRMKDHKLYTGFSLYDVLHTHQRPKKLISLTKNENFVEKFNCLDLESFQYYGDDLDDNFRQVTKRRDIIETEKMAEMGKLYPIFKNHFPDLVLRKIVYYETEHLYFEP